MSIAPLSTKLFRFLAVVASAPSIVLMLVAGSLFTMAFIDSAFSSVWVLNLGENYLTTHKPILRQASIACADGVRQDAWMCKRRCKADVTLNTISYDICITQCRDQCIANMSRCAPDIYTCEVP